MNTRARASASLRLADILTPEANSFGVLRFAMATLVLISHSYLYCAGTSDAEPLVAWLERSLGECAVQVFFILSGVTVAQSFDRSRSVIDFAAARTLRIFPALIVCVLFTSFIVGPMVSSLAPAQYLADPGLYAYVAKTLTLSSGSASLPGVFETNPFAGYVNSSLWTLKYEVICYFGLGLLGFAGLFQQRWWLAAVVGLGLLVATVSLALPSDIEAYGFTDNLLYFVVFFGSGVLTYLVLRSPRHKRLGSRSALCFLRGGCPDAVRRGQRGIVPRIRRALGGDEDVWTLARAVQSLRHIIRDLHFCGPDPADAALARSRSDADLAFLNGVCNRAADRLCLVDRRREAGASLETDRCGAAEEASPRRSCARLIGPQSTSSGTGANSPIFGVRREMS
jgi:hypothetical protein